MYFFRGPKPAINGDLGQYQLIEDKAYTSILPLFPLKQYCSEWRYGQND